ncbi:mitochondrial 18 KDa protein-domain-containing protein [Dipodascopsis tothii]|uniref:mitochondrial 18 KDa protein-domain-containing protein n=1 Tax=Dipodascopsis tothii TaxID=44089 RepID=UPI0034CE0B92
MTIKDIENSVEKKAEALADRVADGEAGESTDTSLRYAAYATRLRIVMATQRYVAYTSDIGESFRPVVNPKAVSAAYAISWTYILGDVAYEGYKARLHQQEYAAAVAADPAAAAQAAPDDWRLVTLERGIFQSIASMGLPAFTIHSTVRYTGQALKNAKNVRLRAYGPVAAGLAVVPALPYLFDEPVEEAVSWLFTRAKAAYAASVKDEL